MGGRGQLQIGPIGGLLLVLWPLLASAGTLSVTVLDRQGNPVSDVVVYAQHAAAAGNSSQTRSAILDQVDRRFDPHVLVVSRGTQVHFPNSDIVAHHVYSFSRPNQFKLPLYKGAPLAPVTFEHEGLVTIGCNIHDDMLAYIVVLDTEVFAKTDAQGHATLAYGDWQFPAEVTFWSPRFRGAKGYLTKTIASGAALEVRLDKALKRPHRQSAWSAGDDEY
ncbi:MAG: methylamine utilization protein [Pseudomonadota bacterium]